MVNKRLVFYALKLWGGCHISVVRGHQHITVQQIPPEFAQEIRDTVLSSCLGHHLYVYLAPLYPVCVYMLSCFSRSDSLQPHGLQPTRLLHPLDSPGKNTGVGCHAFLQGIFPTQGLKPCLLCRQHWLALPTNSPAHERSFWWEEVGGQHNQV